MFGVLRPLVLIGAGVAAGACATSPATPQTAGATTPVAEHPKQFHERQILVTLARADEGRWDALSETLRNDYGLLQAGAFPLRSLGVHCLVYVVPPTLDVAETVEKLRRDARVEHVQPNRFFDSLAGNYSDRYADMQHGLRSTRAVDVHALSTGKGVRVAVIDTGVDVSHPDLRGGIAHSLNFVDGGEQTFNTDAHGTAVAGVIGARANNGIGIVGVAPDVEMHAYKACWYPKAGAARARCSSWTLVKAIDRAILDRAHVINLSLAGPEDVLIRRLIERAVASDIAVVAAVNDAQPDRMGFPASLDAVISVSSWAGDAATAAKSAASPNSSVTAPGIGILTTLPDGRYDFVSGSSLATAHASGVVALLRAMTPQLTVTEIRGLLKVARRSAPAQKRATRVDACHAFANLLRRVVCTTRVTPQDSGFNRGEEQ